jgi:hypothetical protein
MAEIDVTGKAAAARPGLRESGCRHGEGCASPDGSDDDDDDDDDDTAAARLGVNDGPAA